MIYPRNQLFEIVIFRCVYLNNIKRMHCYTVLQIGASDNTYEKKAFLDERKEETLKFTQAFSVHKWTN